MRIRLKNFRCYDDKTFDFGEEGLALLSGSSGGGKTSVILGIYFALFGSGSKVTSYGKTNCMVELEFDGMKIMRTKRPNRVVVNDIYEDDAAQDMINKKFGDTFDTTGYIAQNALNSFVLMSPIDKLEFLEKFAFKDVDLGQIKGRCKALINERHDSLLGSVSQLEMASEVLINLVEPEEVLFPLKCKNSDKEKAMKNEEIKYKNCNTLIKRAQKEVSFTHQELNDLRIFNASISSKIEHIKSINKNIVTISSEEAELSYEGDHQLKKYKDRLSSLLSRRELTLLEERLNNDQMKLNEMKESESKEYTEELSKINSVLWKDYSKEELTTTIMECCQCLEDTDKILTLTKELDKYNGISTLKILDDKRLQLDEYRTELDSKRKLLDTLKVQRELYSCPSCRVNLRFKDEILHLAEETTITDKDIDMDLLKSEIVTLHSLIRRLESLIPEEQRKYERSVEIGNEIKEILSGYEETPNATSIKEDLDSLREYHSSQTELERRKDTLEKSLLEEKFSPSYISFYKSICSQKLIIKELQKKVGETDEHLSEEDLRSLVTTQQQNKDKIESLRLRIEILNEEHTKYTKQIETYTREYKSKYVNVKDEEELIETLKLASTKISNLEHKKTEHEDNILKISKYKQYQKDSENYFMWKEKVATLKIKETEDRDQYASATLLRDKILEAESIAMLNIISSINTHAQLYLDCFFIDNPIAVHLLPFKETKKSKKPQINIEIEYKGMECDLGMLSGGELSRVILAYTLALGEMFNTPLLLLDECTASLDQDMTTIVFNSIREHFTGKLVLIIAHQVITGTFDKTIRLGTTECCHYT